MNKESVKEDEDDDDDGSVASHAREIHNLCLKLKTLKDETFRLKLKVLYIAKKPSETSTDYNNLIRDTITEIFETVLEPYKEVGG